MELESEHRVTKWFQLILTIERDRASSAKKGHGSMLLL